jgi:hypothetical protein
MGSNLAFMLLCAIGLVSVSATILLKGKERKIIKYLPSIITGVLAILFCILISVVHYYQYGRFGYIAIVYVVVLITTLPPVILSLIIAAIFDFIEYYKKLKSKSG